MIIYKTNFDENRCIYFSIKEEKSFIKYMENLEKVRNIIKNKFNSALIYNKKYLKAGKKKNTKGGIQYLYFYYPKVFLEKYYFIQDIESFVVILMKNITFIIIFFLNPPLLARLFRLSPK